MHISNDAPAPPPAPGTSNISQHTIFSSSMLRYKGLQQRKNAMSVVRCTRFCGTWDLKRCVHMYLQRCTRYNYSMPADHLDYAAPTLKNTTTISIERSASWQANSSSASQEIPRIL
jgi:hypothetical protein